MLYQRLSPQMLWKQCRPFSQSLALASQRLTSGVGISELKTRAPREKMLLYAIPLTNKRCFIYCKHTNEIFVNGALPLEHKLINKFLTVWNKFRASQVSVNRKIVAFLQRHIDEIPYMETSLLSIPSQKNMRRFRTDTQEYITDAQTEGLDASQLDHFNFYYPDKLTDPVKILDDLKPEITLQYESHKKLIYRDILLMPLTIPVALVPLVPNVPGFYLLYRVYCHMKVMASVKHFVVLMKGNHLDMVPVRAVDELYLQTNDLAVKQNVRNWVDGGVRAADAPELLLLSDDVVPRVVEALGGHHDDCAKVLNALCQVRNDLQSQTAASP